MPEVKRTIKIVTEQKVMQVLLDSPSQNTHFDKPSGVEGFPLRKWNIQIFLLNEHGDETPASIFSKATYKLHPSFEKRAIQVFTTAPFKIQEEGWGEFDMEIVLSAMDKGGEFPLQHDLNFQNGRYEAKHPITFKNPKPGLLAALKESGPVPGDENGLKKRGDESAKKKKRADKGIDMDKLADNLQRLGEDDLLQVVQMVHDHKSPESYTKNDVENGEFHVDLYTLPDSLIRMLWDFSQERLGA
ncbi:hypothetical protein MMC24_003944 [Lignoscripta atroalba]|nr:hypothetical protein [Lignoscripta atroalba]